jgi:TFIIF-interacting CTD phosphatase-like protein
MKDIIIIDNTPSAYMLHSENGIPIVSWTGHF